MKVIISLDLVVRKIKSLSENRYILNIYFYFGLEELKYINNIENKIIKKSYLFPEIIDVLLKSNKPLI